MAAITTAVNNGNLTAEEYSLFDCFPSRANNQPVGSEICYTRNGYPINQPVLAINFREKGDKSDCHSTLAPLSSALLARKTNLRRTQSEGESYENQTDQEQARDYRRALKQIEGLMHAKRNTPAGDWLDVLVVLLDPNWPHAYVGKSWQQAHKTSLFAKRHVLLAYARVHAETAIPLERWYRLVKAANWTSMDDIRHAAPKSKVLNRDRVRFNVAGGNYRLIAAFDFRRQIVFVKFIGTHAEYDAIDALTVARF